MIYTIELTRAARKELAVLPHHILVEVDKCIKSLATAPKPHGYKKLKGMKGLYRVRVSDYRILYQIEKARLVVIVVRLENRKDVYGI